MPAEWAPHERTWMAWPHADYTLGDSAAEATEAYRAWSNVANAVVEFEPVTMLVHPEQVSVAREYLDDRVELVETLLDDGWMRDIGPTFVKNDSGDLLAVDWTFNGWGGQSEWSTWDNDDRIASTIASRIGVQPVRSRLVNEGGGIHVNGAGVVLLTETVQLGKGRNPDWSRTEVETEIHRMLGTSKAIWIRRGLTRDYEEFGTQGHIDIVACFADENTILYHDQQNPEHPDFAVSHEVRRTLEEQTDFRLVGVPAPTVLKDEHGVVDYSYINHYICNGAVILCAFDDPNDVVAKRILEVVYPDREIVLVDARALFARGGGIHCITQQQPR
jgi:agmatine deiminase